MPNYTEDTFKDSKWTLFQQMSPRYTNVSPYNFIAVQAPQSVACDVIRKHFGIDAHEAGRYDESDSYSIKTPT